MISKIFTSNKKGVTMASLTIYIIVATIVVGILAFLNANFFANISDLTKKSNIVGDYLDFKSSFIKDIKSENNLTIVDFNDNMIRLSNNIQYEFRIIESDNQEGDKYAIYRNDVQIAKNIVPHTETNGLEVKEGPYFEYDSGTNTVKVRIKFYDGENEQFENGTYVVGKEIAYSWENTPNNSEVVEPKPQEPPDESTIPQDERVYAVLFSDGLLKIGNNGKPQDNTRSVIEDFGEISTSISNGNPKWLERKSEIRRVEVVDNLQLKSLKNLFSGCLNLNTIDGLNNLKIKDNDFVSAENAFKNCINLGSLKELSWDTSHINNMVSMFEGCSTLTEIGLTDFNTENVLNMERMFKNCKKLTELKFDSFSTEKVSSMSEMFSGCSSLKTLDLNRLVTNRVSDMTSMFSNCTSLVTLKIEYFNTSSVTSLSRMFYNCQSLETVEITNFEIPNVTDFSYLFYNCFNLKTITLGTGEGMKESIVEDVSHMFENCSSLTTINLNGFNTSKVSNMSRMFYGCRNIEYLDMSGFNTEKVTNMSEMFAGCSKLKSLNANQTGSAVENNVMTVPFSTEFVTNMSGMFKDCIALTQVDLSKQNSPKFKTTSVGDISEMFKGCTGLTNINLDGFNTTNVTSMVSMFENCSTIQEINIKSFVLDNTRIADIDLSAMFKNATNLKTVYVNRDWDASYTNIVEAHKAEIFDGSSVRNFTIDNT